MPEARVREMFEKMLSSPLLPRVSALIRPRRNQDIPQRQFPWINLFIPEYQEFFPAGLECGAQLFESCRNHHKERLSP